ncbi:MAG: hypothetical protein QF685_07920 [Verrucomicrobiota bacterium]|jgi:hypothetical protein|nr:hypothetical protein [Verrucomicrobiota bacterium]
MKIVATLIVSSSVALLVAGCGKSNSPSQEAKANTEEKDQQIAALRKQLAQAKAEASRAPKVVEVVEAKVEVKGVVTDANGLIEKLADDSTTGEDVASQRRVIHYFESLYDAGNDAVPAIASFLDESLDKEFGRKSMRQQLNITSTQMEEMRAYAETQRDEIGTKMREIWGNQELSREERGEKMRAMFTDVTEKYKEMMTPEQRAKLEELGGENGQRDLLRGLLGGGRGGSDRGRGPGGR